MLTSKIQTIEEHHAIVGSRFQLAQLVMIRTKQLMAGKRPKKGLGTEFDSRRRGDIPNQRFAKVALEEIRTKKLTWKRTEKQVEPAKVSLVEPNPVIFGE